MRWPGSVAADLPGEKDMVEDRERGFRGGEGYVLLVCLGDAGGTMGL